MTADREAGLTLIELAIVSAIFLLTVGLVGAILYNALRTTRAAEQEATALAHARQAANQIERDVRGTVGAGLVVCNDASAPTGYCLALQIQRPNGTTEFIRYRMITETTGSVTSTVLLRDQGCASDYTSCQASRRMLANLRNRQVSTPEPGFECKDLGTERTPVRVVVLLRVAPLQTIGGGGGGGLRVETSATARNVRECA